MFKSFSIGRTVLRLTATQRSSLEQAFHWHPTLLSELRRRAVSASYVSSHIPTRRRGLRCAQLNLHTLSRHKVALSNLQPPQ